MNKILKEIKQLIDCNISKYLPDVDMSDLEENGNIYYMNGKNGTEFDWYVNDHLSDFMVFYNDERNLGALKLTLYNDGGIVIYIYGEHGDKLIQTIESSIKVSKNDILDLAIILKYEADDKSIFDSSIEKIDSDAVISKDKVKVFKSDKEYFNKLRERKELYNKLALVSERIIKDGYKVGYMSRSEAGDNMDSGWQFLAGNEDDDYLNNQKKIGLVPIGYVCSLDLDIEKYIDSPIGTELIRVSSSLFEIDNHTKEIHVEKRDNK